MIHNTFYKYLSLYVFFKMFNFIFSLMFLLSILHINIIIVDLKSNSVPNL